MKHLFTLVFTAFIIVAQAQPGTVDKTYGMDNTGTVSILSSNYIQASAMQPDNKLLIGGVSIVDRQYIVLRHNQDGIIDTTFGNGGQVTITVNDLVTDVLSSDGWSSIAVAPDGKIVATGRVTQTNLDYPGDFAFDNDIVVARLLPDGTPDESFGAHGRVVTNLGYLEYPTAIAVQPDGKLLVTGYQYRDRDGYGSSSFLVRYKGDGSLDESFGAGKGYTKEAYIQLYALLVQPDNKIVVGGTSIGDNDFFIARYLPDGTADASFGSNGEVSTNFGTEGLVTQINSLALDTKGRIAAGGLVGSDLIQKSAVARYLPDGALDKSFSENGWLFLPFNGESYVYTNTVLAQPGDKLIATSLISPGGGNWQLALTGLNADGSLDASFGTDKGQTIINNSINSADFTQAAMQSDGKVIVSGNYFRYDGTTFLNTYILTRFNGYPTQVPLFVRVRHWLNNHGISWKGLPADDHIAYYSIERSDNSRTDFTQIAKVSGKSNLNSYSFTNSNLLQGDNYYRIKAVSTDGTIRYSEVASADNSSATASVYPNPVKDYVSVQGLQTNEKSSISIANGSGTVLVKGVSNGSTQYRAPTTNMQPGTYYLHITSGSKTETLKFVKE